MTPEHKRIEEIFQWKQNGFQPRQDDTDWLLAREKDLQELLVDAEKTEAALVGALGDSGSHRTEQYRRSELLKQTDYW